MSRLRSAAPVAWFCALVATLPFASLAAPGAGACLADPQSELPVKLWVYDAFLRPDRLFGGRIDELRFPDPGLLNNPDLIGTLLVGGLNATLGDCGAYNLLVWLQLFANAAAAAWVGRQWGGDRWAGLGTAAAVGLLPLLLVYCVAGAITDMLNVWPYLLSLGALRAAWQAPAGQGRGAALAAGALVAAGFITCPYNAVVFAPAVIPLGVGLVALGPSRLGLAPWRGARHAVALGALAALGGLLVGGPAVVWLKVILVDPDSQMAAASVADSRHVPPYHELVPGVEERYTAYLADFFSLGPGSVVLRDNVARFYRANNPGVVAMAAMVMGALLPGRRPALRASAALWAGTAAFFMLAAVGPFLPITRDLALHQPLNPVWLGLHHLFPGADLLLEPFRYGLVVGACVAIGAAAGVARLAHRWGRWVFAVAPALMLVETLTVAPLFRPLPTTTPVVPAVYADLDRYLGPGAVLELPFFQYGSKLFVRNVFLHQRTHGRAIPHIVEGYPPPSLMENPATATLIAAEQPPLIFQVVPAPDRDFAAGIEALQQQGFAGLIVTPALYSTPSGRARVERLMRPWGPPVKVDGRWIYRL